MNWHDVVPEDVARDQTAWERRQSLLRAREAGLTLEFLATKAGRTRERIRQLCLKGEREEGKRSPVERYLADDRDIREMARREKAAARKASLVPPTIAQKRVQELQDEITLLKAELIKVRRAAKERQDVLKRELEKARAQAAPVSKADHLAKLAAGRDVEAIQRSIRWANKAREAEAEVERIKDGPNRLWGAMRDLEKHIIEQSKATHDEAEGIKRCFEQFAQYAGMSSESPKPNFAMIDLSAALDELHGPLQ